MRSKRCDGVGVRGHPFLAGVVAQAAVREGGILTSSASSGVAHGLVLVLLIQISLALAHQEVL